MSNANTVRDAVDSAIVGRRSIRQFLPTPVGIEEVMEILDIAARSPSGHNTQAWNVHLLTGAALRALSAAILLQFDQLQTIDDLRPPFDSYPAEWVSPYIDRRRQVGKDMYSVLGIHRGDEAGKRRQLARNFAFFDAPVGLVFSLSQVMVPGSALDLGMFMQSLMIAARARGMDTCPQAAFALFHRLIADQLRLAPDQVVICGMSLGYADAQAPVNQFATHREPAAAFTVVHR